MTMAREFERRKIPDPGCLSGRGGQSGNPAFVCILRKQFGELCGFLEVQWGYGGQHYTAIKKSGKRYQAYNTGNGSVIISEKNIRNILIRMNGTIITGIACK